MLTDQSQAQLDASPPDSDPPQARTALTRESNPTSNAPLRGGPRTPLGIEISKANGIRNGFSTRAVILGSESQEAYETRLAGWADTLVPANHAEAELIAGISDTQHRLDRLRRLEHQLLQVRLETAVEQSPPAIQLRLAREAAAALDGLVELLAETDPATITANAFIELAPGIRKVVATIEACGLGPAPIGRLSAALDALLVEVMLDDFSAGWASLTKEARAVKDLFAEHVARIEVQVEAERERQAELVEVAEDRETKKLDRHRRMLEQSLHRQLETLRLVRELATGSDHESSACMTFKVEVRAIGRSPVV